MAEAEVRKKKTTLDEDIEVQDESSASTSGSKNAKLEESWNDRFAALEGKLDFFLGKIESLSSQSQKGGEKSPTQSQDNMTDLTQSQGSKKKRYKKRVDKFKSFLISDESSQSEGERNDNQDALSIITDGKFSDPEDNVGDEQAAQSHADKVTKGLFEIFGEDAVVGKSVKKDGIVIDQSQIEVLDCGFRSKLPNDVTAFAEENFDLFPLSDETEKLLEVPSLDPLVESCLINKFGDKAAFKKSRGKALYSQPYKMLEKIAYRGQQAAKLGISIHLYLQQSMGNLVQFLESEDFSKDQALQQVKDIFAMSTKSLDQVSRSGAYHHIIRRTVAMSDTTLYDLPDSTEFANLPLTGEGVFGSGLEPLLKARKEKKKQLEEMLPEFGRKDRKRKASPERQENKRPRTDTGQKWNNFRIPRVSQENDGYGYRARSGQAGRPYRARGGANRYSRGGSSSYSRGRGLGNSYKQ